jgi:hypothetical protein
VTISVGSPERKVWWRSLTGTGAPVELVIRGRRRTGHAIATQAETRRSSTSRWVDNGAVTDRVLASSHGTARETWDEGH